MVGKKLPIFLDMLVSVETPPQLEEPDRASNVQLDLWVDTFHYIVTFHYVIRYSEWAY